MECPYGKSPGITCLYTHNEPNEAMSSVLTDWGLVTSYVGYIQVNIGSDNGVFPKGTNPKPTLTNRWWGHFTGNDQNITVLDMGLKIANLILKPYNTGPIELI